MIEILLLIITASIVGLLYITFKIYTMNITKENQEMFMYFYKEYLEMCKDLKKEPVSYDKFKIEHFDETQKELFKAKYHET